TRGLGGCQWSWRVRRLWRECREWRTRRGGRIGLGGGIPNLIGRIRCAGQAIAVTRGKNNVQTISVRDRNIGKLDKGAVLIQFFRFAPRRAIPHEMIDTRRSLVFALASDRDEMHASGGIVRERKVIIARRGIRRKQTGNGFLVAPRRACI